MKRKEVLTKDLTLIAYMDNNRALIVDTVNNVRFVRKVISCGCDHIYGMIRYQRCYHNISHMKVDLPREVL